MVVVQNGMQQATEAIRDRFFPVNPDPAWIGESA
jgi:hypothetical protein